MKKEQIIEWLKEADTARLGKLWALADDVRKKNVGDDVHLRGLVEISNYCIRRCGYCGLNAENTSIGRYRMTAEEIIGCADEAVKYGYGALVIQSGEDYGIKSQWMADVIGCIKSRTPLAITLSLGERTDEELVLWKKAGADRYLLRFETSNQQLYEKIHPSLPGKKSDRFAMLCRLSQIGYEIGSGVMIGIPGQSYEDLADDIEWFSKLNLDMIGCGPYISHPQTQLGKEKDEVEDMQGQQVPNTEMMTYKVIALARIMCPLANIPSTTALATLNLENGRELGLSRGANIVMPNLTPVKYRSMYEIYPAKACINETAAQCHNCIKGRILSIGRTIGQGRGDSPSYKQRKSK